MTTILIVQLFVSFFAGGTLITILTLIAEKTNQQISGILMMFPTTLVLGFLFLGLTTNAENVSTIVPATLIPLGIIVFSTVIYVYCSIFYSNHIKDKILQILCSLVTCIMAWFILASPFAIYKFSNLLIGIIGFFVIITVTHSILRSKKIEFNLIRPVYTKTQIVVRAVFTGSVIAIVVFLGKTLNPFWGGIFIMFPAATFATLVILHFYYDPSQLFHFMKSAPLGSISLFIYAISIMLLFPKIGIWAGTLVSYIASLFFGLLLMRYELRQHRTQ
ncbi:MAG: hypothetical protein V1779_08905 [bacterium]